MVVHLAGAKLAAQDLDQVVSADTQLVGAAQTTSTINMTTSAQDLTGTSLTVTTTYANTLVGIWALFDVTYTNAADVGTAGAVFIGTAVVDGITQSGEAHFNGFRSTSAGMWITTLAAAGAHTIKLQGRVTGSMTGSAQTNATHTKWHAFVLGP